MTKKEIYQNNATIAYYSGFGGLEVKHIEYGIDDYLHIVAGAWNGKRTYHKLKVYYSDKDNYIRLNGSKYYLKDFLKTR